MGKKQKREHAGLEASFIGRSQCIKMLQVTIKDFRRLCILKGIYPREPLGRMPGKKKGQTFYCARACVGEVSGYSVVHEEGRFLALILVCWGERNYGWLTNEPTTTSPCLLSFVLSILVRSVVPQVATNVTRPCARKNSVLPTYSLHHLVKERYPLFVDALSDLDDALTLTLLFAALPSDRDVKPKYIAKAKQLAAAWGAYCATTSSVTKAFISINGVSQLQHALMKPH